MTTAREDQTEVIYRSLLRTIAITAVFSVVVFGLLIANHFQLRASDPRYSQELKALKLELHEHPKDEKIKRHIRAVDTRLRKDHLGRIDFAHTGNHLLLIGVTGLLILIPTAAHYRRRIRFPEADLDGADEFRHAGVLGRRAVGVLGALVVGGLVILAIASQGDLSDGYAKAVRVYEKNPPASFDKPGDPLAGLPSAMLQNLAGRQPAAATAAVATTTAANGTSATSAAPVPGRTGPLPPYPLSVGLLTPGSAAANPRPGGNAKSVGLSREAAFDVRDYSPSAAELAQNWPSFRGPNGGIATGDYPIRWDVPQGKGVLWKTEIPLPGWNSPVVWNDRVFLTGADEKKREIYCFAVGSGKLLWKHDVPQIVKGKAPEVGEDTGYAAPTVAADGKRVFAIFPNGDAVCFSFDGKRLWGRNLGSLESMYGYASSLSTFRSLLIVQYDQGSGDDGKSAVLAFQGETGKIVWRTSRPVANSWSSPLVVRSGDQGTIFTCANPWSMAYDALTGKELWRANLLSGDVAPSPAFASGTAYVCNSGSVLAAIRADGRGDITKSHVTWQASDGLPDITSPVSDGNFVLTLTTEGKATCFDAKMGKKMWEHSYEETSFLASLVIAGGRAYLLSEEGVMHVVDAKAAFREEARSPIGEKSSATPAFVDGRIFIRGTRHLFCIGGK